jgi:hypothetical protein
VTSNTVWIALCELHQKTKSGQEKHVDLGGISILNPEMEIPLRIKKEIVSFVHVFILKLKVKNPSLAKYLQMDSSGESIDLKMGSSEQDL